MVPIVWVIKHAFNKLFYIKKPLNNFHAIVLVNRKAHLVLRCVVLVVVNLFGYFFGPRLASPAVATLDGLDPGKATLRLIFGDLGLMNGEWAVLGTVPDWDRSKWPMPDFVRRDPLGKRKPVLVRRSDTDPMRVEAEYAIEDDSGLATDALSGYGAVEIKLTKLLG